MDTAGYRLNSTALRVFIPFSPPGIYILLWPLKTPGRGPPVPVPLFASCKIVQNNRILRCGLFENGPLFPTSLHKVCFLQAYVESCPHFNSTRQKEASKSRPEKLSLCGCGFSQIQH